MSKFVVSARKYRPITFESVVGQGHITSTLKNAIINKQLAHAYLFCGPRGVGKTTCARILAKSINCMNPSDNAEPCGECESCRAFTDSRSFNIHELDAASNNSVNDIRSLTEQVRIPPQIGKYSIYIIDEAHMLSTAAFNAFLKTLEEPPAHAIFILATTEKHKLIPTILSRCQIYDFKRIKAYDLVEYLKFISSEEGVTYDDESLHMVAEKADGCMRDALSMYDKVVSFCGSSLTFKQVAESLNILDYDTYFNFVSSVKDGDYETTLVMFDEVLQKGFDTAIFLSGLASHLRNLLVAKTSKTATLLEVTGSVADRFTKQSAECDVKFIFDALNIISSGEYAAKQSNSQRLHAELTILKLCNLSPLKLSAGSLDTKYTLPQIVTTQQPQVKEQPPQQQAATTQEQEPPKPEQKEPQTTPTPKPATEKKSSSLGLSIKTIAETNTLNKKQTKETSKEELTIDNTELTPEQEQHVVEASKKYAKSLSESRPRLSLVFDSAKITEGRLHLSVPNDIIKEEILTEKHIYVGQLIELSGIRNIDITIEVTEQQEQQLLPIRDEDKLKYLMDLNPEVATLCKTLDLSYV